MTRPLARALRPPSSSPPTDSVQEELRRFYPEYAGQVSGGSTRESDLRPDARLGPTTLAAVARAHGLPPEFVLVTGWVMAHKNHLAVVDALARLRSPGDLAADRVRRPECGASPPTSRASCRGFAEGYAGRGVGRRCARPDFEHGRDFHALGYVSDAGRPGASTGSPRSSSSPRSTRASACPASRRCSRAAQSIVSADSARSRSRTGCSAATLRTFDPTRSRAPSPTAIEPGCSSTAPRRRPPRGSRRQERVADRCTTGARRPAPISPPSTSSSRDGPPRAERPAAAALRPRRGGSASSAATIRRTVSSICTVARQPSTRAALAEFAQFPSMSVGRSRPGRAPVVAPVEPDRAERRGDELLERARLARGDDVVVGPLRWSIRHIASTYSGAQPQSRLTSCCRAGAAPLPAAMRHAAATIFRVTKRSGRSGDVVEEDPAAGEEAVGLAVLATSKCAAALATA